MIIQNLVLGDFQTNCFCVRADEAASSCVLIDTGLGSEPLLDYLNENNFTPEAIIYTHGHIDHIAGVNLLREKYESIEVAIHKSDASMLTDPNANLSLMTGSAFSTAPADRLLDDGDVVSYAGLTFEVFHTPGHTPGGICLYSKEDAVVFVGDTLFADSVGRTDFPGGDYAQLIGSIKSRLFVLPDEVAVYNGHGQPTTIGNEKKYNPFCK